MNNINFKKVDVGNLEFNKYCNTHNLIFQNSNLSKSRIKWFHKTLDKNTRTYGAYDKNTLIGIWSVVPHEFRYNSKIIKVGRAFSAGINSNYRRQGLFIELSRYAFQQEKERNEVEYLFGFPLSTNIVTKAHFKAGWYKVMDIPIYSLKLEDIKVVRPLEGVVSLNSLNIRTFAAHEGSFLNNNIEKRFLNHPEYCYFMLSTNLYNNYIILKPYKNWCHILDILDTSNERQTMLEIAKNIVKAHCWSDLTVWCADNDLYLDEYIRAGFTKTAVSRSMIAYNIKANQNITLSTSHIQNWIEEMF